MNEDQLTDAVATLASSSAFRHGDASTFAVTFLRHTAELPGPADPQRYLQVIKNKLGPLVSEDDSVAVVCPGNGGLVAEVLLAGAEQVIAIEPRPRFHGAIDQVCALLRSTHERVDVRTNMGWPSPKSSIGPFDLIFWPEGLDECRDPAAAMKSLLGCLRSDGLLCVEVTHGENTKGEPPLNSFRPTEETWAGLLEQLGTEVAMQTPGRAQRRVVYRIDGGAAPKPKVKPKPKVVPPAPVPKAAPKPPPPPAKAPAPKAVEKPVSEPKPPAKKITKKKSSRVKKPSGRAPATPPPPPPPTKPLAEAE